MRLAVTLAVVAAVLLGSWWLDAQPVPVADVARPHLQCVSYAPSGGEYRPLRSVSREQIRRDLALLSARTDWVPNTRRTMNSMSTHAYLFPKFPGEVGSVVNLLHVPVWHRGFGYSLDEAFRKSRSGYPAYATLETTAIAWMMCDNFLNGVAMQQVEKQYQLKGHAKFVEIARLFGWEKLQDHYHGFNVDYENNVTIPTDVDSLLLRLSGDVGVDIRPLFHFWGVPPVNSTSLSNSIRAANLPASAGIYDTLIRFTSGRHPSLPP